MSMRWVRWAGGGLAVLLLSVVGWRLSLEIRRGCAGPGCAGGRGCARRRRGAIRRIEVPPAAPSRFHRQRGPARRTRGSPPRDRPFGRRLPSPRRFLTGIFPSPGSGSGISAWKRVNGTVRSTTGGWRRERKGRPSPCRRSSSWTDRSSLPPRSAPPVPDRRPRSPDSR